MPAKQSAQKAKSTASKKPRSSTKAKTTSKAETVETVETAQVVETSNDVVASVSSSETSNSFAEDSTAFLAKLQSVNAMFASLKSDFRALEKRWSRELRTANKVAAKRKKKQGTRQPSGFVKPTLISSELASFLKKPEGTQMARTEVTREINAYIRSHSLQDKANGRKINPDKALKTLLKIKSTDELTYFNLQRYMSPHFAKGGAAPLAN